MPDYGVEALREELAVLEELKGSYLKRGKLPGIIFIPEGLTYDFGGEESQPMADALSEQLAHVVIEHESLGNVIPIIVQGPAELIGQVKHIKFDDNLVELLEQIDKRITSIHERIKAATE